MEAGGQTLGIAVKPPLGTLRPTSDSQDSGLHSISVLADYCKPYESAGDGSSDCLPATHRNIQIEFLASGISDWLRHSYCRHWVSESLDGSSLPASQLTVRVYLRGST